MITNEVVKTVVETMVEIVAEEVVKVAVNKKEMTRIMVKRSRMCKL